MSNQLIDLNAPMNFNIYDVDLKAYPFAEKLQKLITSKKVRPGSLVLANWLSFLNIDELKVLFNFNNNNLEQEFKHLLNCTGMILCLENFCETYQTTAKQLSEDAGLLATIGMIEYWQRLELCIVEIIGISSRPSYYVHYISDKGLDLYAGGNGNDVNWNWFLKEVVNRIAPSVLTASMFRYMNRLKKRHEVKQ